MKVSVLMKKNQIKRMILKTKPTKKYQNPNNNKKMNNKSSLLNKRKRNKNSSKNNKKRNKSNNNKAIKTSNSLKHRVFKMILIKYRRTIEQMLNHK